MIMVQPKRQARKQAAKIERADRKVARATGGKHDSRWMHAIGRISELADQPPLIVLSTATIVAGIGTRNMRLARTGVRMFASHWLATKAKSVVKHRLDRTRPFVMLSGGSYHARTGHSRAKRENSFPSGHTAGAVAVARAVARDYPASAPIGFAAAGAAGAIQLPRGAHYLSDVLVGAAIGWLAEAACRLILPPAREARSPISSDRGTGIGAEAVIDTSESGKLLGDRTPALDTVNIAGEGERPDPRSDVGGSRFAMDPLDSESLGDPLCVRRRHSASNRWPPRPV